MKAFIVSAFLSTLAVAQFKGAGNPTSGKWGAYPVGWIDFNGGDTAAAGESMKKMMGNLKPPPEINRSGGKGPYKAHVFEDPSLPGHTFFAPKTLPPGKKLPLLVWGNGGCMGLGQTHGLVLTDIASFGYVVIANGKANPPDVYFSKNYDMFDAVLWAQKEGTKYNIDTNSVASAGQSCGGMQAYTGAQAPGIKTSIIFNSGLMTTPPLLQPKLGEKIKGTLLYMEGGTIDVGYPKGKADYESISKIDVPKIKAVFLSQTTGHAVNKNWHDLIVLWLNWQLKGEDADNAAKTFLTTGSPPKPFTEHYFNKAWDGKTEKASPSKNKSSL